MRSRASWVVIKFGGTSVNSRSAWCRVQSIVQQHRDNHHAVLLVCSAPRGVSDQLEAVFKAASAGEPYDDNLLNIRQCYESLCHDLDTVLPQAFNDQWGQLISYLQGVRLLHDASEKYQAKVMSYGEVLLTIIGHAVLSQQGVSCDWLYAPDWLQADESHHASPVNHYLNAHCAVEKNLSFIEHMNGLSEPVCITQGFLAQDSAADVVLLGRGGSDISAAYFSAQIQAHCCEIWTDVPGIYTANPHEFASARHITELTYDEAQEIALMGAKVLHPETLLPLRQQQIPLVISYTHDPARPGTRIFQSNVDTPVIKSVNVKHEVTLIALEAISMWKRSGFLADVFACFKQHHISVDLITTAESNVTVSLDTKVSLIDKQRLHALLNDLEQFARVSVISPCASISVVGTQIKRVLYQIKDVFALFRSSSIHLVAQSSNDLSFTIVVDEDQAKTYTQLLHDMLIENSIAQDCFGLSYQQEFDAAHQVSSAWWLNRRSEIMDLNARVSPTYIYAEGQLSGQAQQLLQCKSLDQIFYAVKANSNPRVLSIFYDLGLGFECVSIYEVELILQCFPKINPQRILFTPNFASRQEYQKAIELGVYLTIDNLHPLIEWSDLFKHQSLFLRIDPGFGDGHHEFVETGGNQSKFGLSRASIDKLGDALALSQATVIGLHAHSGSGILQVNNWHKVAMHLIAMTKHFPSVRILNLGGGLGVPEKLGQVAFDVPALDQVLLSIKQTHPQFELWMEPGRYLTAESGVLCARVTQIKHKASLTYIGIDAGMHTLIRPALYGAYHDIVNLSRLGDPIEYLAHIVGPICESGDVMGRSRWMPKTEEGDHILISTVGAYGASMSSQYNLRPLAQEFFLQD